MKLTVLAMYYLKARIVSWLTTNVTPVTLATTHGPIILAAFQNGRRVSPEVVVIPDGVPVEWGPDGPVNMNEEGNDDGNE